MYGDGYRASVIPFSTPTTEATNMPGREFNFQEDRSHAWIEKTYPTTDPPWLWRKLWLSHSKGSSWCWRIMRSHMTPVWLAVSARALRVPGTRGTKKRKDVTRTTCSKVLMISYFLNASRDAQNLHYYVPTLVSQEHRYIRVFCVRLWISFEPQVKYFRVCFCLCLLQNPQT